MKTTSVMIVGVGGQGSLLASRLLGTVLTDEGYDVKVSAKFDIFKYLNLVQPSNIPAMFSALTVLKLDKSKEVRELQLENIFCIFVTFEVSKFDIVK